jgi:hypothetical protein
MSNRSSGVYRWKAAIGIPFGLILFGATLFFRIRDILPIGPCAGLFVAGLVIYIWGCWALARAKGYGPAILLTLCMGLVATPILLLLLPDNKGHAGRTRRSSSGAGSGGGDWAGAPHSRAGRSQEASQIVLGWVLGLLCVSIGIAAVAGYELHWARMMKPEREGLATAIPVSPDKPDPRNDGKLVHVVGKLAGAERLTDPEFDVAVDALRLRRRVWMRQWEQGPFSRESSLSKTDEKGNTVWKIKSKTYDYTEVWSEPVIDSSAFHNAGHENPAVKKIPNRATSAANISVGPFALSPELVEQIDDFQTVPLNEKSLSGLAEPLRAEARLTGGEIYVGANPQKPAIGDLKVRLEMAPPTTVSVIARQSGRELLPCSVGSGGSIAMLRVGAHSVQEMAGAFAKGGSQERVTIWAAGGFACFMGVVFIRVARRRSRRRKRAS